jgi:hypothetical protein
LRDIYESTKYKLKGGFEREGAMERPFEAFSRKLWPWPESRLIFLIGLLAVLDYVSTYSFLTFGKIPQVTEGNPLASWALHTGGFAKLFLVDIISVGTLLLLAVGTRYFYSKLGFRGLGRTAFVFLLVPYFIVIMAVVYNNIFWALI